MRLKSSRSGIVVLGISRDTVKDQKESSRTSMGCRTICWPTPDMVLIQRYGLLKDKMMYGKAGDRSGTPRPT